MSLRPLPVLLLALSLLGLGISLYLTYAHYQNTTLACARTALIDCQAVTHSGYSLVPGTQIPITIPGVIWFGLSGLLAALGLRPRDLRWISPLHLIWTVLGMVAVIYLVRAELVVIHRICEWCTAVHLIIFLSFLLALAQLQRIPQRDTSDAAPA
ncbi:MAG TPA: vitamin K epoxide reductase family protein [Candidatus Nitrosotalea sp.]|nr:vitamin K epoxide reductase family protein [Candidatus Nitrosotalea sp.]